MMIWFARPQGERLYASLTLLTAGLVLLLIVLGAMVRSTDAEEACGSSLVLCNGNLMPQTQISLAWLDWGHRLMTLLVGIAIFSTYVVARRTLQRDEVTRPLYWGVGLLIIQSVIGAGTMWLENPPTLPLLHLGFAVIIFSCLVASVTILLYQPRRQWISADTYPTAVHSMTLMTFVVLMTGAMIVGAGATSACDGFPLCGDSTLNDDAIINLIHRGSVVLLGIVLVMLVWRTRTERPTDRIATIGIFTLFALFVVQALLGAWIAQYGSTVLLSALHVMFAGLTWASAVALSIAMMKQQESIEEAKACPEV